jgi:ABC-type transport system substrate-binding protein
VPKHVLGQSKTVGWRRRSIDQYARTFDSLLQQERQEPDPAQRSAVLQQMETIARDEAPAIFMFQAPDIFGVASSVKGYTPTPDDIIHVGGVSVGA